MNMRQLLELDFEKEELIAQSNLVGTSVVIVNKNLYGTEVNIVLDANRNKLLFDYGEHYPGYSLIL